MKKREQDEGRIAVPYSIIARYHKLRFKLAEPGKKLFLRDLVLIALNEFLDRNDNGKN